MLLRSEGALSAGWCALHAQCGCKSQAIAAAADDRIAALRGQLKERKRRWEKRCRREDKKGGVWEFRRKE